MEGFYQSHVNVQMVDDSSEKSETSEKKPEKVYKFLNHWLEMPEFKGWLKRTPQKRGNFDVALCKICDSTICAKKSEILKHKKTKKHQKNEAKLGRVPQWGNMDITDDSSLADGVNKAEINLYAFMAEHNLPVQVSDRLVPLCKTIFPDSDIATQIAVKKKIMVSTDLEHNRDLDVLYMKLRVPGMFFSINMDETMDEAGIKQFTLTVVYMDGENGVRYSFFDMFKLKQDSPRNIFIYLKNTILSKEIPIENLVGYSSDITTTTAEDAQDSVYSHLRKDCPEISRIKCPCQTIHLAASKACLKLPQLVEDLLKDLGAHFCSVYGQQESFTDLQQFFHVDIHDALFPGITCWLSVKACVEKVIDQYDTLQTYIHKISVNAPSDAIQTIFDTMSNLFTKAYLQFMSYVLGILDEFSTMFRAERPLLHKIKPEVEKLIKDICLNFLQTDYVRKTPAFEIECIDSRYYLPLDQIYLGVIASETIDNLKQMPDVEDKEIAFFFESILDFYAELVKSVRDEFDFRDALYSVVSIVDPQVAQEFNIKSLAAVWKRFPQLKKFTNIQALDNEWKKHALLDHQTVGLDPAMPVDDYWWNVCKVKMANGVQAFSNLYIMMKLLLALPFFPSKVLKESLAR